jgi:hypothetical protein
VGAAALVGAGLMAGVDEIVFHQVLAWHSFYDRGTEELALLSDGLLHGAELVALVAGAGLLADLLRRGRCGGGRPWPACCSVSAGSSSSTGSSTTSCCACTRSATTSTCCPTTWRGTAPPWRCCWPGRAALLDRRAAAGQGVRPGRPAP